MYFLLFTTRWANSDHYVGILRHYVGICPPTLREKITPEYWVIASAKSVLLSRVLLLKKNGYFYPDRVPIPEYSGFNDTIRYFLYS